MMRRTLMDNHERIVSCVPRFCLYFFAQLVGPVGPKKRCACQLGHCSCLTLAIEKKQNFTSELYLL